MPKKISDYVLHPPSGSSLPGSPLPNPYIFYPPSGLRELIKVEKDETELNLMKSALKQWERIYVYPGYPWRSISAKLRSIAAKLRKLSEITPRPRQWTYYYDSEVPEGYDSVMHGLRGLYDNYNMKRFDIPRQGERPKVDIDTSKGDFSSPKQSPLGKPVSPRGDGPDPAHMDYPFPPTGGPIDQWPDML